MKLLKLTLSFLAILISAGSFAQGLSNADVKSQALKDWERAKAYTKEYLDAMPEKGLSFKPTPEVRSFAEQMLHIAQANVMFASTGTGEKPIFADKNLEKSEELKTKDALLKTVMESYDFVINSIKKMDESKLANKVTNDMFKLTTTQQDWIAKGFEHQTHHRGQCTVYLRLMGVTPPGEKLF